MEFDEALRRRRMVRSYASTPVEPARLERVLAAVRQTPSAGNCRGQRYVVVTDAANRAAIAGLAGEDEWVAKGYQPWLSRAPVHVVVGASQEAYRRRYSAPDKDPAVLDGPVPYWWLDAGAAVMTLLLAAVDAGLAAGFLGGHRLTGVADLLAIPPDVHVAGLVTLGHPGPGRAVGSPPPHPAPMVVHRERWGGAES